MFGMPPCREKGEEEEGEDKGRIYKKGEFIQLCCLLY
jgi:hypothetical protein